MNKTFATRALSACLVSLCAFTIFTAIGCARNDRMVLTLDERLLASSPEPPPILSVPVVALLTNAPAFGAQCRIEYPATSNRKPLEGAFLHRGDQFLFAAEAQDKRARGREMTYVWNATANEGFALNDALPGHAPVGGRARVASMQSTGRAPGEKIHGHSTFQEKVTFALSDGSEWQLTVWRSDDLRGVPVRIRSDAGPSRFLIDLTDIRLQEPAARLFEIPEDFTRYDSPKAMFDELFRRESLTRRDSKGRSAFDEDEFQRTGRMVPAE
jgi:hypothetical protein